MGAQLVRDLSGEVPWKVEEAKSLLRPIAHRQEHLSLLKAKLLEEVGEFIIAGTEDARLEEAADVLQVLINSILLKAEPGPDEIETSVAIEVRRRQKHARLGGFAGGLVWET